jgi:hypothetical protein
MEWGCASALAAVQYLAMATSVTVTCLIRKAHELRRGEAVVELVNTIANVPPTPPVNGPAAIQSIVGAKGSW